MGFTKGKKERIERYILEKIKSGEQNLVKKVSETFNVSLNTVYRYLRELESKNIIEKCAGSYILVSKHKNFVYSRQQDVILDEYEIFLNEIDPFINDLPLNVYRIWEYAFTEMVNNAIDHSNSPVIYGRVEKNELETSILIVDEGVGIFQKISSYYGFKNLNDAIMALFKGKLTTDAKNHSGEGIFFTSRMMDRFMVFSDKKIFSHNPHWDTCRDIEKIPSMAKYKDDKGTTIAMYLENRSIRTSKEVFDMFSDCEGGFSKTNIPMRNIFAGGYPVSRSQAKRLSTGFENFKEVQLDFDGIDDLGQGFAHELFVVFQNKHPDLHIIVDNANDNVCKMIKHVKVSATSSSED